MLSPRGLRQRSRLLQAIRSFFLDRGYLEVDTPIRLPVLLPEAEILPIQSEDFFLQTSPELCMKRLLAGGSRKLFQICHCFRKAERGRLHGEEFSMLEWYHVDWSYLELMEECEKLVQAVLREFGQRTEADGLQLDGRRISLQSPWQRLSVDDAFMKYCGCTPEDAVARGEFDRLLVEKVEPELGLQQPVFLYDYPLSLASLARPSSKRPQVAERFELYIGGVELANGFSELTDAAVQRARFVEEIKRARTNNIRFSMPEKFLVALEELPECAGIALGLDRLLMLCLGAGSIAEVVPLAAEDL